MVSGTSIASAYVDGVGEALRYPDGSETFSQGDVSGKVLKVPFFYSTWFRKDGELEKMPAAENICLGRGGLPTIKELALAYNPQGVSEVPLEGYELIAPYGEPAFYYKQDTYKRPAGEEQGYWYWSKSKEPNCENLDPEDRFCSVYSFGAPTGRIMWRSSDDMISVRCKR